MKNVNKVLIAIVLATATVGANAAPTQQDIEMCHRPVPETDSIANLAGVDKTGHALSTVRYEGRLRGGIRTRPSNWQFARARVLYILGRQNKSGINVKPISIGGRTKCWAVRVPIKRTYAVYYVIKK